MHNNTTLACFVPFSFSFSYKYIAKCTRVYKICDIKTNLLGLQGRWWSSKQQQINLSEILIPDTGINNLGKKRKGGGTLWYRKDLKEKLEPTGKVKRQTSTQKKGGGKLHFLPGFPAHGVREEAQIYRDTVKASDARCLQGETHQWNGAGGCCKLQHPGEWLQAKPLPCVLKRVLGQMPF